MNNLRLKLKKCSLKYFFLIHGQHWALQLVYNILFSIVYCCFDIFLRQLNIMYVRLIVVYSNQM